MARMTERADQATQRQQIIDVSYGLFSRRGVRDVTLDELIKGSGVDGETFYRHFAGKNDIVLAFLEERERLWTHGVVRSGARDRGQTSEEQLLAIFDVFDDWFRRDDYEACAFINVLLEMGSGHPLGQASIRYLANIRRMVEGFAAEASLRDPEDFAQSWHLLMKGAIVSAAEGDRDAAVRARKMARWLIADHRS